MKSTDQTKRTGRYSPNFVDMVGVRVGRLVVVKREPNEPKFRTKCGVLDARRPDPRWGNALWLCVCDCGGSCVMPGIYLRAQLKNEAKRRIPVSCKACRVQNRPRKGTSGKFEGMGSKE